MRFIGIMLALLGVALVITGPGIAALIAGGSIFASLLFMIIGVGIGIGGGFIIHKHDT